MVNSTMRKFGYPETLIREYEHWAVLLRPSQVTLGSLILASKSEAVDYGGLPSEAFVEQFAIIPAIERTLQRFCSYERINYLMLMMVDPHVHFHVFPRYSIDRDWEGIKFPDTGWPGPPDLKSSAQLNPAERLAMRDALANYFN